MHSIAAMIALTKIRELDLAVSAQSGRPPYLSAASGLVCVGSRAYVIADDEMHLGMFDLDSKAPGQLIRLFEGQLPDNPKQRKKQKPDVEAIALLPADRDHPHGALLMLGSGSSERRLRGAILSLDRSGAIMNAPRILDLMPVYAALEREFGELNIEGAVVVGDDICLLQRGNKGNRRNAVIRFALADFLDALNAGGPHSDPVAIEDVALGDIDGVPLSFTDAAALPDGRMIFTAAAEDTDNPVDDGRCLGSAIGVIEAGTLRRLERVDRPCKLEGIHAVASGGPPRLLLVSDADDATIPAELFQAALPGYR
jgi:hypothetical protein